jgi:hypothetical protein
MLRLRRKPLRPMIRRKLVAMVALVSYVVATFGMPLPAIARKDGGPAFPCQDLPCGCLTAEQCWKGCCCLTPEQRWAWAREHHVEPPDYAERPGEHDGQEAAQSGSCCMPREPACCAKKTKEPTSAPAAAVLRWTLGLAAQRCQGSTTLWTSTGAALPPTPPSVWSPAVMAVSWLCWAPTAGMVLSVTPPDPPPRPFRV